MRASSLLSLPLYLACLPFASAWIFTWHTADDELFSYQGSKQLECKSIDNPKGNVFNWEPQAGHWCFFVYSNSACEEPNFGYTCQDKEWADHVSSKHAQSFKVTNNTIALSSTTTSSASTSSTSATVSTSSTPSSATVTSTKGSTDAASSSSATSDPESTGGKAIPSGGTIAGIVVGVLAAVAIAGILIFFLCWRRRKNTAQTSAAARTDSTSAMAELSHADEKKSPVSDKPGYQAQRIRELHGSNVASEIGAGTERYEVGTERHEMNVRRYELDATYVDTNRKD
ncbi:hypothetical protein N7467_009912 [Penicillium canescens]|nr:hypothetical protein N7467_009912 [Penicillium canescens]